MSYDHARLAELRQQIARKKYLERSLNSLTSQERVLSQQVRQLKAVTRDEQADVKRLEKPGLTMLFYQMIGKLDEQLDKERAEACAARVKYDTAVMSLAAVETDISQAQEELASLKGCEKAYEEALHEKLEAIKAAGVPETGEIRTLEEELARLEARKTELLEAITAGEAARSTLREIITALDEANEKAAWDMLGSSFLADAARHDHLAQAQERINTLQAQLNRFRTELTDVSVHEGIHVSMGSFTRFADYFFDGLGANWALKDHIQQALEQANQTEEQIEDILRNLSAMAATAKSQYNHTKARLDEAVMEAQIG